WDEDHQWLLRFTRTRLRGKALRWYAGLDTSIKKDWDLFVQALFDQHPLVDDPETDENGTPVSTSAITLSANPEHNPNLTTNTLLGPVTPNTQWRYEYSHYSYLSNQHTYASRQYDASSVGMQIGLLRVAYFEGMGPPQYIWWDDYVEQEILNQRGGTAYSYGKRITMNRHEALIVSFLSSSAPHQIGCLVRKIEAHTLRFANKIFT
ncbi:hypothetical protein FRC00_007548, partial [Tulasnella sp. 408]